MMKSDLIFNGEALVLNCPPRLCSNLVVSFELFGWAIEEGRHMRNGLVVLFSTHYTTEPVVC